MLQWPHVDTVSTTSPRPVLHTVTMIYIYIYILYIVVQDLRFTIALHSACLRSSLHSWSAQIIDQKLQLLIKWHREQESFALFSSLQTDFQVWFGGQEKNKQQTRRCAFQKLYFIKHKYLNLKTILKSSYYSPCYGNDLSLGMLNNQEYQYSNRLHHAGYGCHAGGYAWHECHSHLTGAEPAFRYCADQNWSCNRCNIITSLSNLVSCSCSLLSSLLLFYAILWHQKQYREGPYSTWLRLVWRHDTPTISD